jgi:hypothetical protein
MRFKRPLAAAFPVVCLILSQLLGCCCNDSCLGIHERYSIDRPCYGYHGTCWRAWPDECPNCPPEHAASPSTFGKSEPNPEPLPERLQTPMPPSPPAAEPPPPATPDPKSPVEPKKEEPNSSLKEGELQQSMNFESKNSQNPAPIILSTGLEFPHSQGPTTSPPKSRSPEPPPRPPRPGPNRRLPDFPPPVSVE